MIQSMLTRTLFLATLTACLLGPLALAGCRTGPAGDQYRQRHGDTVSTPSPPLPF